jgi:hypothetical protein
MTGVGIYACLCSEGFKGELCNEMVNYCDPNPCLNNGECVQSKTDKGEITFECHCKEPFKGDNCEILIDLCQNVTCKHNGICKSWGTYWNCTCVDHYEGKFCEISPSLCNDPAYCNNHGECVKDKNGFDYCNCHPQYTGLRCESQTTDNFNLHFTGIVVPDEKRQQIESKVNHYRFSSGELTFCAWIKYEMEAKIPGSTSPFAILSYLATDQNWIPIFWISNLGVATPGNRLIEYKLLDSQWYHIAIVCNLNDNTLTLRVNGKIIKITDFTIPVLEGSFRIVLGEHANGDQTFIGEMSLVQVFDYSFTDEQFMDMLLDCPTFSHSQNGLVISWLEYTTVDQGNFAVLVSIPGICVTSTCLPGRSDCSPEHGAFI